jgi:hypothetical protein
LNETLGIVFPQSILLRADQCSKSDPFLLQCTLSVIGNGHVAECKNCSTELRRLVDPRVKGAIRNGAWTGSRGKCVNKETRFFGLPCTSSMNECAYRAATCGALVGRRALLVQQIGPSLHG